MITFSSFLEPAHVAWCVPAIHFKNIIISSKWGYLYQFSLYYTYQYVLTCWKQISLTLAIADEHLSICKRRKAAVNADTALTMNDTLGSCGSTSHVNWSLFRPRNMLLSS